MKNNCARGQINTEGTCRKIQGDKGRGRPREGQRDENVDAVGEKQEEWGKQEGQRKKREGDYRGEISAKWSWKKRRRASLLSS